VRCPVDSTHSVDYCRLSAVLGIFIVNYIAANCHPQSDSYKHADLSLTWKFGVRDQVNLAHSVDNIGRVVVLKEEVRSECGARVQGLWLEPLPRAVSTRP
jgi:hypothetical protein